MINSRQAFPSVLRNSLTIKPGHENFVSIKVTNVAAHPDIRSIPPEKRNCYFPDESEIMELYKVYAQTACIYECQLAQARDGGSGTTR